MSNGSGTEIINENAHNPLSGDELLRIYDMPNLHVCMNDYVPISMDGTSFMEFAFDKLPHDHNIEGYKRLATIEDVKRVGV